MPSIGAAEIVIILVLALLVFGPKRLPEMGRSLGRTVREFRKASDTARKEFGVDEIENEIKGVKKTLSDVKGDLKIDIDAEAAKSKKSGAAVPGGAAASGAAVAGGAAASAAAGGAGDANAGEAADVAAPAAAGDDDPAGGAEEVLVGEVVDDAPASDASAPGGAPAASDANAPAGEPDASGAPHEA